MHTTQGSALVLMSLSQAMAGLQDIEGVQTHRSWWVARSAIVGVVEDGRRLRLRLIPGIRIPEQGGKPAPQRRRFSLQGLLDRARRFGIAHLCPLFSARPGGCPDR